MLILFIGCVNIVQGQDVVHADGQSKEVSEEEAVEVVQNYIKTISFNHSGNEDIVLENYLYDIDDTVLGYHFELFTVNVYQGYIIVSATLDRSPILESNSGYLLDEQPEENEKIYYLGAFSYIFTENSSHLRQMFDLIKDEYIKELNYDLGNINRSAILTEKREVENLKLKPLDKMPLEFEHEWEIALSPSNSVNSTPSQKRLIVTRVWQRTSGVSKPSKACGPAVAVMINNYYKSKGKYVKGSNDYGGHANYINRMITEMGTGSLGTSAAKFCDGIWKQLNVNYGTSTSPWRSWTLSANNYFESYKTSITMDRPVALRFDNIFKGNKFTKYHFFTGIGYNSTEAIVKEPDGEKIIQET